MGNSSVCFTGDGTNHGPNSFSQSLFMKDGTCLKNGLGGNIKQRCSDRGTNTRQQETTLPCESLTERVP